MAPQFQALRQMLEKQPQLVLTKFGLEEYLEFNDVQKLCFEIWRCGATMRMLGKEAPLFVQDHPVDFFDGRSEDLDRLVKIYDMRENPFGSSATGTVFIEDVHEGDVSGILLAFYNIQQLPATLFEEMFRRLDPSRNLLGGLIPNFIWGRFNLAAYYVAHKRFADAFEEVHG